MPQLTRSCPNPHCGCPLIIPQPAPDKLICPKCRCILTMSPSSKNPGSPAVAPLAAEIQPAPFRPAPALAQLAPDSIKAAPVERAPAFTAPASVAPRGRLAAILLLTGLAVLVLAGVGTTVLLFCLDGPKGEPVVADSEAQFEVNLPKLAPPPDPRIKIVQPAVDKGVAYLKAKGPQLKGMRCGYVGLHGLTLLECGVPPDDPAILRIAEFIRIAAPTIRSTYDLAASLFFLNRWNESRPLDDKDRKMARSFTLQLIAGQQPSGIWGYVCIDLTPAQEITLLTALQGGSYKPSGGSTASMSNTQFAMLAVWGSRKYGVPVREPLLALAAYFHAYQHPDGHWNYPNLSLAATSTCAGLLALAIETALLKDKEFASAGPPRPEPKKRADVDKAFAFLAKTIGRKKGDPGGGTTHLEGGGGYGGTLFDADAWGDLYFLWTLERVGVIYSKERIGGKDWYDWGYPIVMKAQQPDGSWSDKHGPLIDTCFALLFLKRANIAKDLTDKLRLLQMGPRAEAAPPWRRQDSY